ncbi:MAG: TspO/MBR family protein [Candidatus Micrarchaeota archaeon]
MEKNKEKGACCSGSVFCCCKGCDAEWLKIAFAVILCELAGLLGSIFTMPAIAGWYATLNKPSFNPPNWLFAPAWTMLYALMGVSAYLVWKKGTEKKEVKIALGFFCLQLLLNLVWSLIFFGMKSPFFAFLEIILLWLAIAATIWKFYGIDKRAGALLIPYILWVTFASVLNYYAWMLNA